MTENDTRIRMLRQLAARQSHTLDIMTTKLQLLLPADGQLLVKTFHAIGVNQGIVQSAIAALEAEEQIIAGLGNNKIVSRAFAELAVKLSKLNDEVEV